MHDIFIRARRAAVTLQAIDKSTVDSTLIALADNITANSERLLEANKLDLERMAPENPKRDRLALTPARIADIAEGVRSVAALPSPVGKVLAQWTRPNGMSITKISVPFGVIGIIYEARPNVTFDVFALCFKAGSSVLLKGGHEASETNRVAIDIIRTTLDQAGLSPDAAILLPDGREATAELLNAHDFVDVIIPRGSRALIDYVRENAKVPVIETGAGVCHTYFHSSGDIATARDIVLNAKTRRVSVCNALDCMIVDRSRLNALPAICFPLPEHEVHIYADDEAYAALDGAYPYLHHATEEDFGREWLDYKMTVATVEDIDEAIEFIAKHGSHHSECIVAENREAISRFQRDVDAACVYANVSTAFTDGGQFGFGAEIGISTQKLHARGPMALPEITTYKYLITGSGQTRR